MPGVADVRYDRQWIRAVDAMRPAPCGRADLRWPRMLVFAAALTVASVVRFALVARREEIHIMQLVGAPIAYIRGPFVVEGLIQGGVGAIVALVVLWITFFVVRSRAEALVEAAIDPAIAGISFASRPPRACFWRAWRVGSLGGFIAARRHARSAPSARGARRARSRRAQLVARRAL